MKHKTESKHTGPQTAAPRQHTTRRFGTRIQCQGGCRRYYQTGQLEACSNCGKLLCFICRQKHWHNEEE